MDHLARIEGFDWDQGNIEKNWERHKVSFLDCEEVFFNRPLVVAEDTSHSKSEGRYYALGGTNDGRLLFVVFTIRNNKIRVISARDMNRKERRVYREEIAKTAKIQE
jgi:uncharacterized DUF497 family protein